MNELDCWTCDAMEKYGGTFVKNLAALARSADKVNLLKIKGTFTLYWRQYERMGRSMRDQFAVGIVSST